MLQSLYSLAAAGSFCWFVISSLWVGPHWISYFNEAIGGPLNGPEHLLGSNVDWGQDLPYLAEWQSLDVSRKCCILHLVGLNHPSELLELDFHEERSHNTLWEVASVNELASDAMLVREEASADVSSDAVVDGVRYTESRIPITYSLRVQRLLGVK